MLTVQLGVPITAAITLDLSTRRACHGGGH